MPGKMMRGNKTATTKTAKPKKKKMMRGGKVKMMRGGAVKGKK